MATGGRALFLAFAGVLLATLLVVTATYAGGRWHPSERSGEDRLGTLFYVRHAVAGVALGLLLVGSVLVPLAVGHGEPSVPYARRSLLAPVVGVVFGCAVAARGIAHLRTHGIVERTEVTDVSGAGPGTVAVAGRARPAEGTVETPFTGREAVCYAYEVTSAGEDDRDVGGRYGALFEWLDDDRTSAYGADVEYSGTDGRPFHVEDDTGRLLVDPDRAAFAFDRDATVAVDLGEDPPERVHDWLWEQGLGISPDRRRFTDRWIAPGDRVYVVGTAVERDGEPVVASREGTGRFLVSAGAPDDLGGAHGTIGLSQFGVGLAMAAVGYVLLASSAGLL